ncbi:MAG: ABC transporter substrate-binding protein [Hyphomonadaceae bacterium]
MFSLRTLIASVMLLLSPLAVANADAASEAFVKENATKVLSALDDADLTAPERIAQFNEFMDEFTNLDGISRFVLGKYSRRFSAEDLARYRNAYQDYSLANYEAQFEEYRGADIEILSSHDRKRDSIVKSIVRKSDGDALEVSWRVRSRGEALELIDVGLNLEGSLLWLAVEQRAQFLDLLDRNDGSADSLISKLEELTAELNAPS